MTRNQLIRKTLYAVVAAVLGVLGIAGIVSAEQADQWTATAHQLLEILVPLAGSASLGLAASKVHRGSDSMVTKQDLRMAVSQAEARALADVDAGGAVAPVVDVPFDVDVLAEGARAYAQMTRDGRG